MTRQPARATRSCVVSSPLGRLRISEADGAIVGVRVTDEPPTPPTDALLREAAGQLAAYFAGGGAVFSVPFRLPADASPFARRVWQAAAAIPPGETRTYGEIARVVGAPGAARAVGRALHANPLLILIPCHRVRAAHGEGGFALGEEAKRRLLALDRRGL